MRFPRRLKRSLVAFWSLDDASWSGNGDIMDDSPNANDGDPINSAVNIAGGKKGKHFADAATNQYLRFASSASLRINGDLTLACWFKSSDAAQAQQDLISPNTADVNKNYCMRIEAGVLKYIQGNETLTDDLSSTVGVCDGVYHHLVITIAHPTCTFYVDGANVKEETTQFTPVQDATTIFVSNGAASTIDGAIDQIGIWERVLTAEEVLALYNSGIGRRVQFDAVVGGIIEPVTFTNDLLEEM